jgi:hypothetical protein
MYSEMSRTRLAGAWVAAVIVTAACSVSWGIDLTVANGELWLVACLVPPAVMLLVWRAPAVTVAELLYSVNKPSKDARR